jgi:TnpA family transposase
MGGGVDCVSDEGGTQLTAVKETKTAKAMTRILRGASVFFIINSFMKAFMYRITHSPENVKRFVTIQ